LDKTSATAGLLRDWEFSSKLHAAEKVEAFFHGRNELLPGYHSAIRDFLLDKRDDIKRIRNKRWPKKGGKGTHPNRWDRRTLGDAVAAAEAGCRACLESSRTSLVRIHDEHYPKLCWAVHGSGLTLVRGIKAE